MLNNFLKIFYKLIRVEKRSNFLGYGVDQSGKLLPVFNSKIRHESLEIEQIRRIEKLKDILIEAYLISIDEWIDGFKRDSNPEQEI